MKPGTFKSSASARSIPRAGVGIPWLLFAVVAMDSSASLQAADAAGSYRTIYQQDFDALTEVTRSVVYSSAEWKKGDAGFELRELPKPGSGKFLACSVIKYGQLVFGRVELKAGADYRISARLAGPSTRPITLIFREQEYPYTVYGSKTVFPPTKMEWESFALDFTAAADTKTARLFVVTGDGDVQFQIDDLLMQIRP